MKAKDDNEIENAMTSMSMLLVLSGSMRPIRTIIERDRLVNDIINFVVFGRTNEAVEQYVEPFKNKAVQQYVEPSNYNFVRFYMPLTLNCREHRFFPFPSANKLYSLCSI